MRAPFRVCTRCLEPKPASPEFFRADPRYRGGLNTQCRACYAERQRKAREENPSRDHEYYIANKDTLLANNRVYRQENADRIRQRKREYREAHREQINDDLRRRYAADKLRYQANSHAYYEANRERVLAANRLWAQQNPDLHRGYQRTYDLRKRTNGGTLSARDIADQHCRQNGRCYYCGDRLGSVYDADHIFPVSKGGSSDPWNIVLACPTCNRSKGPKMVHEFIPKSGQARLC
jgi:5-methylcytosine-specific restriction endonuclease McrA